MTRVLRILVGACCVGVGWIVLGCSPAGAFISTGAGGWVFQNPELPVMNTAYFVDASAGWIVGAGGTVVHTSDGGQNWAQQDSNTVASLKAVVFSDEANGWAVGVQGTVIHTTNGGATWKPQNTGVTTDLAAVACSGADTAYAVGSGGTNHQDR